MNRSFHWLGMRKSGPSVSMPVSIVISWELSSGRHFQNLRRTAILTKRQLYIPFQSLCNFLLLLFILASPSFSARCFEVCASLKIPVIANRFRPRYLKATPPHFPSNFPVSTLILPIRYFSHGPISI